MNNSHNRTVGRRVRERLSRREDILRAARKVFFAKGFMNATVDEIAEHCGLAKGTIYLYFKSKEEIYVSLMLKGLSLLKQEMEKIHSLRMPSDRLVEKLGEIYFNFYRKNKEYFRIMFLSSHPDVRARVSHELLDASIGAGKACLQVVSDVIKRGVETGMFRKVDPWAAATILWAMINGTIMSHEQDPICRDEVIGLELEKILKEGTDIIVNGLKEKS